MLSGCRGSAELVVQVQRSRCKGAEVLRLSRGAEVQRCIDGEVQRCRGLGEVIVQLILQVLRRSR